MPTQAWDMAPDISIEGLMEMGTSSATEGMVHDCHMLQNIQNKSHDFGEYSAKRT